jgi:hypothetical protein
MRISLQTFTIGPAGQATSYSHSQLAAVKATLKGNEFSIYLLRDVKGIFYVGESKQGAFRAMRGLKTPFARTTAYKWRRNEDLLSKNIECLTFSYLSPVSLFREQKARRCLEAEITYELRRVTGAWPRKMTEIHFYESLRQDARIQARLTDVCEELRKRGWITSNPK